MRLEIKYPCSITEKKKLEGFFMNIKNFKTHHPARIINSIYFDDLNFSLARDNINGISKRFKCRIRYYGENIESHCNLEIKKKDNKIGFKKIINTNKSIEKLNLTNPFSQFNSWSTDLYEDPFCSAFLISRILFPKIKVSYKREYYIFDKNIRVTLDSDIKYSMIDNSVGPFNKNRNDELSIIEVKFNVQNISEAQELIKLIPLKPKRFSKYIRGLSYFNSAYYF